MLVKAFISFKKRRMEEMQNEKSVFHEKNTFLEKKYFYEYLAIVKTWKLLTILKYTHIG